ncbi:hypothetical protein NOQ67_002146 [Enterococcus faecalis]|uniref:hypothetical protein n=1 Tax=Enterococcus faecalis TaxID=1351 RepID=UPI0013D74D5E|nr:hypothetical protein [Enterococcus faecalis]EJM6035836.1 hypothetical protein [Enterococcus faecalis]NFA63715.1 hypothetical protein [Enterococcus faecalis]HAP3019626.1 hypothetical protein [Enterococcus faecalis]
MNRSDKRIIWKEKSDFELILTINNFIEKHEIGSARSYQRYLKEYPKEAPGMWFIANKYGSWEQLLKVLGKVRYNRYRWNEFSDEDLTDLVLDFNSENNIKSQGSYEKQIVGKNMPSLSTLKKRFEDVRFLFRRMDDNKQLTNFELLSELRDEIYKLGMESSLSMDEFRLKNTNPLLPSPFTIMRKTNRNWEELMEEIGFNYRKIKVKKLSGNLKKNK